MSRMQITKQAVAILLLISGNDFKIPTIAMRRHLKSETKLFS